MLFNAACAAVCHFRVAILSNLAAAASAASPVASSVDVLFDFPSGILVKCTDVSGV